jgi:hypothetical protein
LSEFILHDVDDNTITIEKMIKITREIIFFVLKILIFSLRLRINYLYILIILLNIIKNLWINTDYYT